MYTWINIFHKSNPIRNVLHPSLAAFLFFRKMKQEIKMVENLSNVFTPHKDSSLLISFSPKMQIISTTDLVRKLHVAWLSNIPLTSVRVFAITVSNSDKPKQCKFSSTHKHFEVFFADGVDPDQMPLSVDSSRISDVCITQRFFSVECH